MKAAHGNVSRALLLNPCSYDPSQGYEPVTKVQPLDYA